MPAYLFSVLLPCTTAGKHNCWQTRAKPSSSAAAQPFLHCKCIKSAPCECRSQSKVLESLNLFEKTKDAQTRSQAFLLSGYYRDAEAVEQEMHHLVDRLRVFG